MTLVSAAGIPLVLTLLSVIFGSAPASHALDATRNAALVWHVPMPGTRTSIRGARLFTDAPPGGGEVTAIARSALRANPQLSAIDALQLARAAIRAARRHGLNPDYFAALLLQESAFDPRAISSAGAVGIAQFMVPTALAHGVDPWEPYGAIEGSARLLAEYLVSYRRWAGGTAYALALAAYNAGPQAVVRYHGVPPYPETRAYIADIVERWAQIVHDR